MSQKGGGVSVVGCIKDFPAGDHVLSPVGD